MPDFTSPVTGAIFLDDPNFPVLEGSDRGNGHRGILAPGAAGASNATKTVVASLAYFLRFVPSRDLRVVSLAYGVLTAAGSDDAVDVGIYDGLTLNRLVSTGSTTGQLNSTGVKNLAITPITLVARKVYYAALVGAAAVTGAVLVGSTFGATTGMALFGSAVPELEAAVKAASLPLPASASPIDATATSTYPVLAVREV